MPVVPFIAFILVLGAIQLVFKALGFNENVSLDLTILTFLLVYPGSSILFGIRDLISSVINKERDDIRETAMLAAVLYLGICWMIGYLFVNADFQYPGQMAERWAVVLMLGYVAGIVPACIPLIILRILSRE